MAAKKKAVKKAAGKKRSPTIAKDDVPETVGELFDRTAEDDAENAKLGQAAQHVKACHLLVKEAELRLRAARQATSPESAIQHDLERVRDILSDEASAEAMLALENLGR